MTVDLNDLCKAFNTLEYSGFKANLRYFDEGRTAPMAVITQDLDEKKGFLIHTVLPTDESHFQIETRRTGSEKPLETGKVEADNLGLLAFHVSNHILRQQMQL